MRKILTIVAILVILLFSYQQEACLQQENNMEKIVNIESTNVEYDLGELPPDTIIQTTLRLRNMLDEDLVLKEILSGCECLDALIVPKKVKKGGIFEIEIKLDLSGYFQDGTYELFLVTKNKKYGFIQIMLSSRVGEKNIEKKLKSGKVSS